MKKLIGFLGLLCIGGGVAGAAVAWQQVTSLPSWYTDNAVAPPNPDTTEQSARRVEQKLKSLRNPATTVKLNNQEISDMVAATVTEVNRQAQLPDVIRGVNAELAEGKVKAGAVIDFAQLDSSQLTNEKQQKIAKTLKRLPGVGDRQLYVGIESVPTVRNGRFEIDPTTRVQIGNLSLSLDEAAKYVGVAPSKLQADINRAIPMVMSDVALQDVNIQDQNLVIRSGAARK
ncbi:hypothetical protein IQ266_11675 [filamentous cyanobacterium LEGE 11480]|uniref:Uncharacterized protein n=1 Tax=Romeriopsis navalis LEGE 11480 TaxID=2777977 RepID=A0A928Z2H4_9CYAN|nr:hypothetical protein [Romeriopsis navalis]MBE9030391.1 hypothetical protein [Romeriopsis navalis LEGE 11480]